MITWKPTTLRGTILSCRKLRYDDLKAIRGDLIDIPDPDCEPGDMIEDREGDVTEVITTEGRFLLIAQNIDGHGHLYIVEPKEEGNNTT